MRKLSVAGIVVALCLGASSCTTPGTAGATDHPVEATSPSGAPVMVTVPELISLETDTAVRHLAGVGLAASVISEYSTEVSEGLVISTDPVAGAEVPEWSEVLVVVSRGIPCPNGVTLPTGVDKELVCGDQPTAATTVLAPFVLDAAPLSQLFGFKSPTGNIACQWYGPDPAFTVSCTVTDLEVDYPDAADHTLADPSAKRGLFANDGGVGTVYSNQPMLLDDFGAADATPVLEYGQLLLSTDYARAGATPAADPIACHSASEGVTCSNTVTRHGFKLAADQAATW